MVVAVLFNLKTFVQGSTRFTRNEKKKKSGGDTDVKVGEPHRRPPSGQQKKTGVMGVATLLFEPLDPVWMTLRASGS